MVGIQLVLFAVGWWASARGATVAQAAMRGLALFNFGMGIGTALVGLRGMLPYFVAYPFANLLSLGAIVVLWRAGQAITGPRYSSREQLVVLLVGAALILWFGRSAASGQQRVVSYFLASGWVAVRGGWQSYFRLRAEALRVAALALLATSWTTAALFFWRAAVGLTSDVRIELNDPSDTSSTLALILMVAVFSLNMVFAQIVFGRTTAELKRLSRHDSLTGLYNRRAAFDVLQTEWKRFVRTGVAFSVACIDIDHFKAVNDAFGHAAGDVVLSKVAQRLRQHARPGDTIGRIGGEEFLIVLNGCDAQEAGVAAERFCLAIGEMDGLHPAAGQRITISVGVATSSHDDVAFDDVLARADKALYDAKSAGRNVVRQAVREEARRQDVR